MKRLIAALVIIFGLIFSNSVFGDTELSGLKNIYNKHIVSAELQNELYPIGFSNKGMFAYLLIPADEAVGCFFWDFFILDVVEDQIKNHLSWKDTDCMTITDIDTLLEMYGGEFEKNLAELKIIRNPKLKINKFPLKRNGETFSATLTEKETLNTDSGIETPLQIIIKSSTRGKKTIGTIKELISANIPLHYDTHIVGYIKSPYEDRIIVVIEQEHRGYEGPPNIAVFSLFGSSLKFGFK